MKKDSKELGKEGLLNFQSWPRRGKTQHVHYVYAIPNSHNLGQYLLICRGEGEIISHIMVQSP